MTCAGIRDTLRAFSGAIASRAWHVFMELQAALGKRPVRRIRKEENRNGLYNRILRRGSDISDLPGQGR
jgi:hypothetical protein